jgi:hypothetical protein
LRPKKRNDGTPENYYLDFVLFQFDKKGNEEAFGEAEEVTFEVPKTRENRKKKTKVRNLIETKIKQLKSKKDSRRRAKKTLETNIKKLTTISKKSAKRPTATNTFQKTKQFNKSATLLEKYYAEGKLTEAQYNKELDRILKEFTRE